MHCIRPNLWHTWISALRGGNTNWFQNGDSRMKRTSSTTIVIAMLAIGLLAAATEAALLSVDINGNEGSAGATQTGFDNWDIADGADSAVSKSFGSIDVTITAVDTSTSTPTFTARNRGRPTDGGSITEGNLHRDWITGGNDLDDSTLGDEGLDILIEGLPASTSMTVTLWSYEAGNSGNDQGNSQNYSDWFIDDGDGSFSATSDTLAQDNWEVINFGDFDEDGDGRFTITGSTNGSGEMLIFARGGAAAGDNGQTLGDANGKGSAFLNGIEIIPEPASLALLGLGGALMLGGRKRRA